MRVTHTFPPFINKDSEIIILGTMPSVKSREAGFFYMHPQNRFWRLLSDVYGDDFPKSTDEKRAFLKKHQIALYDVLESCDITGSSDSSIKNPIPADIPSIIKNTAVSRIFVTGKTAEKLYKKYLEDKTGIKCICLPSPSPANCAVKYEDMLNTYKSRLLNRESNPAI